MKNIFLFFICYSFGNAQEYFNNNTIIPAPNFYKVNGDSIVINGQIKVVFEKKKFSAKELKTAQIFESAINTNVPRKKSNIEVLFITTDNTLKKRGI